LFFYPKINVKILFIYLLFIILFDVVNNEKEKERERERKKATRNNKLKKYNS
jgi:hypothetical protein